MRKITGALAALALASGIAITGAGSAHADGYLTCGNTVNDGNTYGWAITACVRITGDTVYAESYAANAGASTDVRTYLEIWANCGGKLPTRLWTSGSVLDQYGHNGNTITSSGSYISKSGCSGTWAVTRLTESGTTRERAYSVTEY